MRQVFMVQAHEGAEQLKALASVLAPTGSTDRVIFHLDRASALWRDTQGQFLAGNPRVDIIAQPVRVRWGHSSQLAATRLLLRAAMCQAFDLAHLISGADWPLVTPAAMAADHAARCHIEAVPGTQQERMEQIRLDSRMLRPADSSRWQWYTARGLRAGSRVLPARRAPPWGRWHKGSQWWSLPRDVCGIVLAGLDKAFRSGQLVGTVCADEHLIQTIVAHHCPERLAGNRRFIRWDGGSSPAILTADDWPAARRSGAWFARKLSIDTDSFFLRETLAVPREQA